VTLTEYSSAKIINRFVKSLLSSEKAVSCVFEKYSSALLLKLGSFACEGSDLKFWEFLVFPLIVLL